MRKWIILLLTVVMVFQLSACTAQAAPATQPTKTETNTATTSTTTVASSEMTTSTTSEPQIDELQLLESVTTMAGRGYVPKEVADAFYALQEDVFQNYGMVVILVDVSEEDGSGEATLDVAWCMKDQGRILFELSGAEASEWDEMLSKHGFVANDENLLHITYTGIL